MGDFLLCAAKQRVNQSRACAESSPEFAEKSSHEYAPAPRATTCAGGEAIMAEAERQFARAGFEGVSLDSIAAALDLHARTCSTTGPVKPSTSRRAGWRDERDGWPHGRSAAADDPEQAIRDYAAPSCCSAVSGPPAMPSSPARS